MDTILKLVGDVAQENGVDITVFSEEEARALRRSLSNRFAGGLELTTESVVGVCHRGVDSWIAVKGLPMDIEPLLLANPRDSVEVFAFQTLKDAILILEEAPPFSFMLTDRTASFLIAHDEYDRLVGCGRAAELVKRFAESAL